MKTKLFTLILFAFCAAGFYSCSDDDNETKKTSLTLTFNDPDDLQSVVMSNWAITLTERNTAKEYTLTGDGSTFTTVVPEGDYKITGECDVTYTLDGSTQEGTLRISSESNVVTGDLSSISLEPYLYIDYSGENGGFLIQEIFYTGTATPEGKQYSGDKYIKLYNNTDKTLYADGLFIATTMLNTSLDYTYSPDIINDAVPVDGIIIIPGDGTQYPVEPGKSFLITESAVNHKSDRVVDGETVTGNSNSFDLTGADMEWVNAELSNQPADNPNVPNAQSFVGFFTPHVNGLTSIIIGRLEDSQADYLANRTYEYTWTWVFNGVSYTRGPFVDYQIPNAWVMDAVYTSVEGKDVRPVFSTTIDMGWTYCGAYFGDLERYGKSVRRKVLTTNPDDREILKDTNNSAVDFTPNATPSLAE
jgi:hypothetical protein